MENYCIETNGLRYRVKMDDGSYLENDSTGEPAIFGSINAARYHAEGIYKNDAAGKWWEIPPIPEPDKRESRDKKKAVATIIFGPPGAGKMALAKQITIGGGRGVITDYLTLQSPFGLGTLLRDPLPRYVISRNFPRFWDKAWLKSLVTEGTIIIEDKYGDQREVTAPYFIFLAEDIENIDFKGKSLNRRFCIIRLKGAPYATIIH